ncbi:MULTISPECIES: alpha/beta fold hydrolase [Bradyrhizobium]|uniref:alpha/beta fold hydrolase n=1 Tax=Bradyrhizobium TaxID=374 RepID=UPI001BA88B6F|nr:alpha/beta hydrolase [Bradyrhizobium liaoningense]MBR0988956.1 alpha/beta hydrolase [Bradyrhizobium liaoningense]GMO32938.1 alpha/beta hydrolase [Bradyrhizobium sp. TM233]
MKSCVSALVAMSIVTAQAATAVAAERPVSIVLVHGAFVDGSGWKDTYNILSDAGYEVLVVQQPTITLRDDVAETERVIAKARHPVILVGHSYGGMVITEAGDNPRVRSLVYLAAFAPDAGESVSTLAEAPAPAGEHKAPLVTDGNYLLVDRDKFPTSFAADVDVATTRFMGAAQLPWGLQAVQTRVDRVAWKTKPTHYMVTSEDHMIPPTAQRTMARRAGAKMAELKSSHAVMLSHPREVAAFIRSADPSAAD